MTMAEIESTSLAISAIFLLVGYAVMLVCEETCIAAVSFGVLVAKMKGAISMADNNTNNILILTFDGEYIPSDSGLIISPFEMVCLIGIAGCNEEEITEMKEAIATTDWDTFCAACECESGYFTVAEMIDFVNILEDHYILLPNIHTLAELGEFIYDNHWDTSGYEDKIRHYINFEDIGNDLIVAGEAAKTNYGYVLIIW